MKFRAWEQHIETCLSCERQPEIGLDTGEICDEGREIAEALRVRRRLWLTVTMLAGSSALMAVWERC